MTVAAPALALSEYAPPAAANGRPSPRQLPDPRVNGSRLPANLHYHYETAARGRTQAAANDPQYGAAKGRALYEEYNPFGTTAYWSANSGIDVSRKRYRYIGKERDEETGLYQLGARYYASWLGRWTSADPIGLGGGVNRFAYSSGNPIRLSDPSGMAPPQQAEPIERHIVVPSSFTPEEQAEIDAARAEAFGVKPESGASGVAGSGTSGQGEAPERKDGLGQRVADAAGGYASGQGQVILESAAESTSQILAYVTATPRERAKLEVSAGKSIIARGIAIVERDGWAAPYTASAEFLGLGDVGAHVLQGIESARSGDFAAAGRSFGIASGQVQKAAAETVAAEVAVGRAAPTAKVADAGGAASAAPPASAGAMRRLVYKASPKHGPTQVGDVGALPKNGQAALDTSIDLGPTTPRRVGIDYDAGEFVVFDQTVAGEFHGHVRTWQQLGQRMQSALREAGMASKKGKILRG